MIKKLDEVFLSIAKITILLAMGLGLFGALGLGITAIYEYSKTPVEPAPEKKAPEKEVSIDELIKSLTPRKDDPKVAPKREEVPGTTEATLAYMDEITKLYRCSVEFARKVGVEIEDASGEAARIEKLRGQIEAIAKRTDHGAPYVRSAVAFTCDALSQPAIIKLKADELTKSVFLPTLNFHLKRWRELQTEKSAFEGGERDRVTSERASESLRIAGAKAKALTYLYVAAGAFATFLTLALYLLGTKIELNLRDIGAAIQQEKLIKSAGS